MPRAWKKNRGSPAQRARSDYRNRPRPPTDQAVRKLIRTNVMDSKELASGFVDKVRTILCGHLSKISAEGLLVRTCVKLRIQPEGMQQGHITSFVEHLEPSLRLYLDRVRIKKVLEEIQGLAGRQLSQTLKAGVAVPVVDEDDIDLARTSALRVAKLSGIGGTEAVKVATVVSELARNQFRYAGGGSITLTPLQGRRRGLRIVADDQGPGIPNLDEVLSGNYRSKTGLGLGLLGTKRLMDRFEVETKAGEGTTISAEKHA